MKQEDLISVIIPVYNSEKYIKKAIECIQAQTWTNFEVIFVNDCSRDSSEQILKKQIACDLRFRYVNHDINKGCAAARNSGISQAKGEYAICLDVDDWYSPLLLEHMVREIKESGADVAICNSVVTNNRSKEKKHFGQWNRLNNIMKGSNSLIVDNPSNFPNICELIDYVAWSKMFRLSYFKDKKLWFPELKYYEDIPFAFLSCLLAKRIVFVNESLIHYTMQNDNSMTSWTFPKQFFMLDAFNCIWKRKDEINSVKIEHELLLRAINNIIAVYKNAIPEDKRLIQQRLAGRLVKDWNIKEIIGDKRLVRCDDSEILNVLENEQRTNNPVILYGDNIGIICDNNSLFERKKTIDLLEKSLVHIGLNPIILNDSVKHFDEIVENIIENDLQVLFVLSDDTEFNSKVLSHLSSKIISDINTNFVIMTNSKYFATCYYSITGHTAVVFDEKSIIKNNCDELIFKKHTYELNKDLLNENRTV